MNGKIENAICITLTMSEFDDISIIDDTVRHSTIFVRGSNLSLKCTFVFVYNIKKAVLIRLSTLAL